MCVCESPLCSPNRYYGIVLVVVRFVYELATNRRKRFMLPCVGCWAAVGTVAPTEPTCLKPLPALQWWSWALIGFVWPKCVVEDACMGVGVCCCVYVLQQPVVHECMPCALPRECADQ